MDMPAPPTVRSPILAPGHMRDARPGSHHRPSLVDEAFQQINIIRTMSDGRARLGKALRSPAQTTAEAAVEGGNFDANCGASVAILG